MVRYIEKEKRQNNMIDPKVIPELVLTTTLPFRNGTRTRIPSRGLKSGNTTMDGEK